MNQASGRFFDADSGNNVLGATACFRVVLEAISRPARILRLPVTHKAPDGFKNGSMAILLTLADVDTPVWLAPECDTPEVRSHLRFHVGCPILETPSGASFAVMSVASDLGASNAMPTGTAEYPDRSATVILESPALVEDTGPYFSGPGIKDRCRFDVEGASGGLWSRVADNHTLFPCGLDWIFTSPTNIAALPRTAKVEV